MIVELEINFLGHGFEFEVTLIHFRRERVDVGARWNSAHAAHHLLAFFRGREIDQELGAVRMRCLSAQADAVDGDDNWIESLDPIHWCAFVFHALDAEIVRPGERYFTGAKQLRGKTMTAAPERVLSGKTFHILHSFFLAPNGG